MIYDSTVLGMDYLDCSNQTLSRIDFKVKDSYGNIVNLHGNHLSFFYYFYQGEWRIKAYSRNCISHSIIL